MIVSPIDQGWKIIFHKAHALLAMDIGLKLDRKFWPIEKFWAAGMESIGEHDNDQPKWNERDNLTVSGAPLDYRQREQVDLKQAKAVVTSSKYKSSFIVLMVSAHFQKLYGESKELEVQRFLEELTKSYEEIILNMGLKKEEVAQCYEFLRFCDDLSLALCQNDFDSHKEPVQIRSIVDDRNITLNKLPTGEYQLQPWIFAEDEAVFHCEYFHTSKDFYNEDQELRSDLDFLHPKEMRFLFRRQIG